MLITIKSFIFLCFVTAVSFFILHFTAPISAATLLHLNGNWSTPFGDDDGPWVMGQAYNLSINHDPTAAINFSGNIRYATNEQQGADKTATLSPSAALSLNNDLFRVTVNGALSRQENNSDANTSNHNWSSNFSTNYTNPLLPQFRLNYSETNSTNDASPATLDSDSKNFSGSIDYSYRFVQLRYNYRNSQSMDNIDGSETQTTGHAANIHMAKSLFNERLALNASYKFVTNNSEAKSSGSGSSPTIDLISSAASAGTDNTPLTGTLPIAPSLNDRDLDAATSFELPGAGDSLNLALQVNLQSLTRLNIYFDRPLTTATQQRLHWTFYSSQDNNIWVPLATIPAINYLDEDNSNTTARISFPQAVTTVRYIKAVIETDPGLDTAFVTEFMAQEQISGTNSITNDYVSQNFQTSINYHPWRPWQLGYSFNRSISDSNRSVLSVQDNHTVSSHLNLNRFFILSLSMNENIDKIEGLETETDRSYAFSYQATLLDNMNFSLNSSRNEHYTGDEKTRTADSISASLSTVIIPDLTANMSYQWSKSINYVDTSEVTGNSYTLNLMARVNPRLNLSYFYSYSETGTHNVSLLYHPSELLSFTTTAILTDTAQSYSSSLNWRLTKKIQTDINYLVSIDDKDTIYGSRLNLSWNLSSSLSIRQYIAWSKSDTVDSWSGLLSVSYNFQ